MAVLKVARMGHPILRQRARELTPEEVLSPRIQKLIEDMVDTMHDYSGVGLAAPQVHEGVRLSVVEFAADNPRYDVTEAQGLQVFINPEVEVLDSTEQGYWEGCLSVPGMRGLVQRPRKIRVRYLDRQAQKKEIVAEGFLATVLQHEFDHLDGRIYVDRIKDLRNLSFNEEYQRYHLGSGPELDD
ncbi:MAG: peptide deformylase [Bdellovibrionales bacterium]|nr:peptide deformylase [Bdellovibrionales bacterium]